MVFSMERPLPVSRSSCCFAGLCICSTQARLHAAAEACFVSPLFVITPIAHFLLFLRSIPSKYRARHTSGGLCRTVVLVVSELGGGLFGRRTHARREGTTRLVLTHRVCLNAVALQTFYV